MVRHGRYAILVIALNLFTGISFGQGRPADITHLQPAEGRAETGRISVLSYNVKGMPWPVAWGRDAAMEEIAGRLASSRLRGEQPDIVLLQEAFTDSAREIGRRAGYAHIAFGPDADEQAAGHHAPPLGQDWSRGEAMGKRLGSGLAILSDFPILAVKTLPFGDQACAGFDCLANKGVMMALVRVPGRREPVRIFNTHLNARKASGVPVGKANLAFRRQLDLLARFIRRAASPGAYGAISPVIIGGDFNIGQDENRVAAFAALAGTGRLPGFVALSRASGAQLLRRDAIIGDRPRADLRAIIERRKDLLFASPALRPLVASVPFGTEASGAPLSDHFGYRIDYALQPQPARVSVRIAANTLPFPTQRSLPR